MVTHGQALLMLCHSADAHFTILTSSKAWGEVDKHEQVKSRKFRSFCHTEPRFVLKMIIYFIANFGDSGSLEDVRPSKGHSRKTLQGKVT